MDAFEKWWDSQEYPEDAKWYARPAWFASQASVANWLEEQRNFVPATGEEFAAALRAIGCV